MLSNPYLGVGWRCGALGGEFVGLDFGEQGAPLGGGHQQDGAVGAELAVADGDAAGDAVGDLEAVVGALGVAGLAPLERGARRTMPSV